MSELKRDRRGRFLSRKRKPRAEAYPEPIAYPAIQADYPILTTIEPQIKKKKKKKPKKAGWIW